MHRGFNLSVSHNCFGEYHDDGRADHEAQRSYIDSIIDTFKDLDGSIIESRLSANWFPQIDSEVFISHAHEDSNLAIGLAGFLQLEFGISSFIDSCVWGYYEKLLKLLDDEYCWQERNRTYNYRKRNRSTAHVHMMLSAALVKMINQCECVIFLNTPASISSSDYINGSTTESPWIYTEVVMTSLIQRRAPADHRALAKRVAATEALRVKYDVDLSHLASIGEKELQLWRKRAQGVGKFQALDILYGIR